MIKIGFFGTPELAKNVLEDICDSNRFEVCFAVTQADKPVGRGLEIKESPVKAYSKEKSIPVYSPEKIRNNNEFIDEINKYEADYFIVVAYGKIMPNEILEMPKKMCINVHGSILPKYRGASPIQSALMAGDKVTGVTIMKMSEGMDEGDIIDILEIGIDKFDTSELLYEKFQKVSGRFLIDTLDKLDKGVIQAKKQDNSLATYCKKINKEDGLADFNKSAEILFNLWKGLTPWPGLYTQYKDKKLIIVECDYDLLLSDIAVSYDLGEVIVSDKGIGIVCSDGILILKKIKLEGKKAQDINDFINGYKDLIGYNFLCSI
ncbi:MAG: methionyl-tRNA formyltransferase [Candidatus Gracilibacteria bacterium]|nr:methionyl-tRNA formyltransferase [Candidatus Gracilibacteria bacterium]